jgi:hypothetical protein
MSQFVDGFMFTAGGICALLCVFAVAAFCEFVATLLKESGRREISNAIVDNAVAICRLAERMKERRSEFE